MGNFDKLTSTLNHTVVKTFSEELLVDNTLVNGVYKTAPIDPYDSDKTQVVITLLKDDALNFRQDMTVIARNEEFIISRVTDDGTGLINLMLERQ